MSRRASKAEVHHMAKKYVDTRHLHLSLTDISFQIGYINIPINPDEVTGVPPHQTMPSSYVFTKHALCTGAPFILEHESGLLQIAGTDN